MIVYPAIDLRAGMVVRLKEGDPTRQTVFSDNPLITAQAWFDQGAQWVHMVNLDGAFQTANDNLRSLEAIARIGIQVQFGGGLRTLQDVETAMNLGASRVVLGTVAVEHPDIVFQSVERFGSDRICIALDAREGKVTTHGWQQITNMSPAEIGKTMVQRGVQYALYTDVHRDGSLIGLNIHQTVMLARETGLKVIASGGISAASEIYQLARSKVIVGVIIGMALYEGKITLAEALMAARHGDAD